MLQLKPWSTRGASHCPAIMGKCYSHVYSLIHLVNELPFKEMRTWVSARFHLAVFVYGVNQKNKKVEGVQDSQHQWWKASLQTFFQL